MKIVITSDIHDNLVNLGKCLKWCEAEGIQTMICCGDVTTLDTLHYLLKNYSGLVYLALGNIDMFTEKEIEGLSGLKDLGRNGGVIKLGGKKIGICHEPYLMDRLTDQGTCDMIFYGHTHEPWIKVETRRGASLRIANPGTLAGMFNKATFAVWDTEKREPELKILELL